MQHVYFISRIEMGRNHNSRDQSIVIMITPSTFIVTRSMSVHGGGSGVDRLHFSLDLMIEIPFTSLSISFQR